MKKKGNRKGFTLIEIMFVVSLIGLLAAIGIPLVIKAYSSTQDKVKASNIVAIEKAKGILALPSDTGMAGAIGLTKDAPFDAATIVSLCEAMGVRDLSDLKVGGIPVNIGTLTEKANYDVYEVGGG